MNGFGVIFDVDGVLVDSYAAHFESWRLLGQEVGFEISEQQFVATFGRTSREVIKEFWPQLATSSDRIAELDSRKEELFRQILKAHFPAMPGARELIEALAAAGFALAVGSSGPPENVQLVLKQVDPQRRIRAAVTGMAVTRGKPDPQVFLLGAERLDLPPQKCVVVEDAAAGVRAAKAAGCRCIGLCNEGRDPAALREADRVVRNLTDISPSLLKELLPGAGERGPQNSEA